MDAKGEQSSGVIEAANESDALAKLRQKGLYPTQISEAGQVTKKTAKKVNSIWINTVQLSRENARW